LAVDFGEVVVDLVVICESIVYLLVMDIFGSMVYLLAVDVYESVIYLLVVVVCESVVRYEEKADDKPGI
jgi:hypothetical protein